MKNGHKYLPWSSAWTHVKTLYPDATYGVVKTDTDQLYHTDGKTCYVETWVKIGGETQFETLAVFDYKNNCLPLEDVSYMDIEKSIKRCLTKNIALFGLGLSLWIGEELSDLAKKQKTKKNAELVSVQKEIIEAAKEKIRGGKKSEEIYSIITEISGVRKPADIDDLETANRVLSAVQEA